MTTPAPIYIYVNEVPCRIEQSFGQAVHGDSCLVVPKSFLGANGDGDVLLRDVTGDSLGQVPNQQQSLSQEILNRSTQEKGFILLPDPVTGLVRVERFHRYQTVRFVGEHLLLTGSFVEYPLVPPSTSMADADIVNSLSSVADQAQPYPNDIANEMLGFSLYLRERARGVGSVVRVASEWYMLPLEAKQRYCKEGSERLVQQ